MDRYQQAYVFLKRRYTSTAKPITALFIALTALMLTWLANSVIKDHANKAYLRDHGVSTFGIVTKSYAESGRRSTEYYLDYAYIPLGALAKRGPISATNREVSRDNYDLYPVGSHIPTKYDPRDIYNTHLDVLGYWSNSRLALSASLDIILYGVALLTAMIFPWLLVGWLWAVVSRGKAELA